MGTPRAIKKQTGYPTSDEKMFDTYKEAVLHQSDIDLDDSCGDESGINSDDMKKYLKSNVDVVQAYIKQHLTTPKKPAKKKTGTTAAAKKTATSEAAK